MPDRLALIDGDVLCYLSFEPRWNKVLDEDGNFVKTWDEELGKFVNATKTYTSEEDAKYLRESWARFQTLVQLTVDATYCDDYMMAVQGPYNYRVDLFDLYKNHRPSSRPSEMSRFVPLIRQLAVKAGMAIESTGREADDYLRIWAEECSAVDQDYIICSNDKDLGCIVGKHYNVKTKKHSVVDQEYAWRLYYEQLLQGDATDGIPGIPGVGPKKAANYLADCETVDAYQRRVVDVYKATLSSEWKQHLLANGKLIHIQRHENDWFDLKDWDCLNEVPSVTASIKVPKKKINVPM